jgi:hypothetical protein
MTQARSISTWASAGVALALCVTPLYAQTVTTGAFVNTAQIERQLTRGASKKADVQKLLGIPGGTGQLDWMPPPGETPPALGAGPRDIWFYNDIEATDMQSSPDGYVTMKVRMQILLVFFKGDVFDGYLWSTNELAPTQTR